MTIEFKPEYSRRRVLRDRTLPRNNPHAGLWLDKFLVNQPKFAPKPKPGEDALTTKLVKEVCKIGEPDGYATFFNRWLKTLKQLGVTPHTVKVNGRLSIGLGRASVIETGITLHHTYGVPVIPGSALKGLASSYAHQYLDKTIWAKGEPAHKTLFGAQDRAGGVIFYDALPLPKDNGKQQWKLEPDVITVHHKVYYMKGDQPPADWDNPTPISFISVTGAFLIALVPDSPKRKGWEKVAYGILQQALDELGIGAKTSSGYGRLSFTDTPSDTAGQFVKDFLQQLNELPNNQVAQRIHSFYQRWRTGEIPPEAKQRVAKAILNKVEAAKRTKASRGKGWYKALDNCAENGNCPE